MTCWSMIADHNSRISLCHFSPYLSPDANLSYPTSSRGLELWRASRVEDSVSHMCRSRPDLIQLNLMIPALKDGYSVLEKIHAGPGLQDLPVILRAS